MQQSNADYISESDYFLSAANKDTSPVYLFFRESVDLLQRKRYGSSKHGYILRFCVGQKDQSGAKKKQKMHHHSKNDSEEITEAHRRTVNLM